MMAAIALAFNGITRSPASVFVVFRTDASP